MTGLSPVLAQILAATRPDALTFVWAAVAILAGALGVVVARNPVHSALMLVMTLFGVAVIFIELQANFLAAVQVIVYAGAIVVLFLFVIMLLGVDKQENLETDPLWGQRPVALALVVLALAGVLALGIEAHWAVGAHAVAGARNQSGGDVARSAGRCSPPTCSRSRSLPRFSLSPSSERSSFRASRRRRRRLPLWRSSPGPNSPAPRSETVEPAETEPAETEPVETEPVEKKPVLRSAGATQARDEEART